MRLASSCSYFDMTDEEAFKMYKDAGYEALNLSYINKEEYMYDGIEHFYSLGDDYIERAKEQRRLLDEIGLVCNQTHAPYGLKETDELNESNYHFLELVRSIEVTSIVGAPLVVIHPMKPASFDDVYESNIRMFKALLPYCEKFGVKLALETCHLKYRIDGKVVPFIDCAKTYCEIITALGNENIVACIDLGHTAGGVNHLPEVFVSEMQPGILQGLHVQDCDYMHDNHTTPFFQYLNWTEIMKALSDIDYTGDFTYEDVNEKRYFPKELRKSVTKYRAEVGKYLISLFDKFQEEKKAKS